MICKYIYFHALSNWSSTKVRSLQKIIPDLSALYFILWHVMQASASFTKCWKVFHAIPDAKLWCIVPVCYNNTNMRFYNINSVAVAVFTTNTNIEPSVKNPTEYNHYKAIHRPKQKYMNLPSKHRDAKGHTLPHPLQFLLSFMVSMHFPKHDVPHGIQTHWEFQHASVYMPYRLLHFLQLREFAEQSACASAHGEWGIAHCWCNVRWNTFAAVCIWCLIDILHS